MNEEHTNLPSISWLKLDVVAIVHKQTAIIIVPVSYVLKVVVMFWVSIQ